MSNRVYNLFTIFIAIIFPALITLYSGLSVLWEWPNTDKVVATAGLFMVFLGVLRQVVSAYWAKKMQGKIFDMDGDGIDDLDGSTAPTAEG